MQTLNATDTGGLMAAWRATGGALTGLDGAPEAAADDGLATGPQSRASYCAEDGLAAMAYSNARSPVCADDGLTALGSSRSMLCGLVEP